MTEMLGPAFAGPVSVTELASRAGAVLRAVRAGQVVPVSRDGVVVAIFQPTSAKGAARLGFDLDDRSQAVGARELERGNPSAVVDRAAKGEAVLVTVRNVPAAVLTPAEGWDAGLSEPTDLGAPVPTDSVAGLDPNPHVVRSMLREIAVTDLDVEASIVVRPVEGMAGIVQMSEVGKEQFGHGEVVALGVGKPVEQEADLLVPMEVGDTVVYRRFGGTEVTVEDDEFLVLDFNDVLATVKTNHVARLSRFASRFAGAGAASRANRNKP